MVFQSKHKTYFDNQMKYLLIINVRNMIIIIFQFRFI